MAVRMKRILCYGDSNTYGYDPRSYLGGRYPETIRWTGLLKRAGWEAVNKGKNGREIPEDIQDVAWGVVQAFPVDIVAIMLGGNDLLQNEAFVSC